jgi:Ni,Fe-hydrogenase III small subunit
MAAILLATGVVVEAVLIRLGQTYGSTPEDDLIVREREHRIEVAAVEDLIHKQGQI